MPAGLKIVSFRGHTEINDEVTYRSYFVLGEGPAFDTFGAQTIESERPEATPVHVRSQPDGIRFILEIQILGLSQTSLDQIKQWFDPMEPRGYLVCDSNYGEVGFDRRRILCAVEKVMAQDLNVFKISLRAADGIWEADTLSTNPTANIDDSGDTFNVFNGGNTKAFPVITLTPKTLMPHTESWIEHRNIVIANRSEMPLWTANGSGYPILLGDVSSLGITPGNDVRVIHNGVDIPRWFAGDKLWVNLEFSARRIFTVGDTVASSGLAPITASNPEGFRGWPSSGYLLIDNEAIEFTLVGNVLTPTARGALGTTAASHAVSAIAYWVQHPFLYLIWDYTTPQAANESDDLKPLIDLDESDNTQWVWHGPYFNNGDMRSGAWRQEFTEDNPNSEFLRTYEGAGRINFQNAKPETNKPLGNNAVMEVPCALSMLVPSLQLTSAEIPGSEDVPIEGFAFRQKTIRTIYTYEQFNTGEIYTLDDVQWDTRVEDYVTFQREYPRYEIQQTQSIEVEIVNIYPVSVAGPETQQTVYFAVPTGNFYTIDYIQFSTRIDDYVTLKRLEPEMQTITQYVDVTTFTEEAGTVSTQTGISLRNYGVDSLGNEALLTIGAIVAVPVFRVRFNSYIPIGEDQQKADLTHAPNPVEEGTNAITWIDDITMSFDIPRTPKIVIGTNTGGTLYLASGRLQNDTTGDFIDFSIPAIINQIFQLDCVSHTLTDLSSGVKIPAQMEASNAKEWLPELPGNNVFSYTQPGIVAGAGRIEINESHRNRWL